MKKNSKADSRGFTWSGWLKASNPTKANGYHCFAFDPKDGWKYWFVNKNDKKYKHAPRSSKRSRVHSKQ